MAQEYSQDWISRREIPNLQIKEAADQYEQARLILSRQPPGTGVFLPTINAAAMAIELYLKCLAGEVIHIPEGDDPGSALVHAQARTGGHKFIRIFQDIKENVRCPLESIYVKETGKEFKHDLSTIEEALVASRYPYEPDMDLSRISLRTLASIAEFLQEFVSGLEPREFILWSDGSVSPVEHL